MATKVNLTSKEQMYISDAVSLENLFLTKCNIYADQMQDKELKSLLFSMVKNCREHASELHALGNNDTLH